MNVRAGVFASLALAFLVAGTGCSNKTSAERESLLSQNQDLKTQLDAERQARQAAEARANASIPSATQPAEAAAPEASAPLDLSAGPTGRSGRSTSSDLGSGITRRTNVAGEEVIEIPGDVLFDSGKAALKPSAKKTLDKVAAEIKRQYPSKTLRIEGHTDPAPVKTSGWDDNWDLGAARARAVLLYLSQHGVSQRNMYIASFAANDLKSSKNMALNRRVDIVVVRNAK